MSAGPWFNQNSNDQGITRIRRVPSKTIGNGPPKRLAFIGELKGVFENVMKDRDVLNFRDILQPMSNDELKSITLDEEILKKKELEAITRSIKKIESKENEPIKLENLKKPN